MQPRHTSEQPTEAVTDTLKASINNRIKAREAGSHTQREGLLHSHWLNEAAVYYQLVSVITQSQAHPSEPKCVRRYLVAYRSLLAAASGNSPSE